MKDIDSESLFNAAAAITATTAALIFVVNVEFAYSPVSKVLLVGLFLAGVFLVTQRAADRQQIVLGYGVIVATGVGLFFDVVNTFDVGNTSTALGLLAIAGLLFWLRTRLDEESHFVTGRQATYALGVVAVLAVGVLLVDIGTGGLAYELQPESEIEFSDPRGDGTRVASVEVTNPTPLPERVRVPQYAACTAGNWSAFARQSEPGEQRHPVRTYVNVQDGYNEFVFGFDARSYPVELHHEAANVRGETFPVRVTSTCPDEDTGSPYVALFETSENRLNARPV